MGKKRAKRVRSQAGQRLVDYEPTPSAPKVTVWCPMCGHGSDLGSWYGPAHKLPEIAPLVLTAKIRWPRKPDGGGRGFFWELVDPAYAVAMRPELEGVGSEIIEIITCRMIDWIQACGQIGGKGVNIFYESRENLHSMK